MALACRVLGVSRSGFHAALVRPESERARADRALSALIADVHAASRRTYGAPRVRAEIRAQGVQVGLRRVSRLMRLAGLRGAMQARKARRPRAARTETPDLLRRQFSAGRPDRVWCADLTQIWTREGWLYLAAVLDLHSRRIVGHAAGRSPSAELVERALASAFRRRRPGRGLIHHSDWGAAYVSGPYLAALERAGAVRSHSRPGTPLDNAVIESFFSTVERELLSGRRFATRAQARLAVVDYIETFYNPRRRHSSLGFLSPVAFEASAYSRGVSTKAK